MEAFLAVFAKTISVLLGAVNLAMFARMILSFFPLEEGNRAEVFLTAVTEPFIIPVRALLYLFNIGQDSPIDWAFSLSFILLSLVQVFLPVI